MTGGVTLADPLVLPTTPTARPRGAIPLLASIVPVIGGVVMWMLTGSLWALCFAALGPLMALAALLDGARTGRRDRRRATREGDIARGRLEGDLLVRHAAEREVLGTRHPDIAHLLTAGAAVWRPVIGSADSLVVGRGARASAVRVVGGDAHTDPTGLRARAVVLLDAPVTLPLTAGVCVQGPPVLARAVVRALVVQLCLAQPPARLALVAAPAGEQHWSRTLPHWHRPGSGRAALRLAVVGPGEHIPADADIVLAWIPPDEAPPERCGALISLTACDTADVIWAAETKSLEIEAISSVQAHQIALALARRGEESGVRAETTAVAFAELRRHASPRARGGLAVAIGRAGGDAAVIDLVADGPHAIVAGVTGSGKSELLITWVAALCDAFSTSEVALLLADFKGGTAFDSLAALPHVTGVITDLDGAGAKRAVESLRAELRWREAELARAGARDVDDERVQMPRLVIVVDEFAAVLAEHPELHAVFTDVAARGRGLGMHLVLGTQRVSGVVRDALLANCPVRISLRVADAHDSRAVVGTDEAALLPGDPESRGLAWVRRASDGAPVRWRIALTTADDIHQICRARKDEPVPRRSWLPQLPTFLPLDECDPGDGTIVLGIADEPEQQRQRPVVLHAARDRGVLVVGGASSGKTGLLEVIGRQHPGAVWVSADPERAWDALVRGWSSAEVMLIDDVDALLARLPAEYAHAALERLESLAREAGLRGAFLAISAQRVSGAVARVADLLPHRVILGLPSRSEHLAAGGEAATFTAWVPPGRGVYQGRSIQCAVLEPRDDAGRGGSGTGDAIAAVTPGVSARPWRPAAGDVVEASPGRERLRSRRSTDPAPPWSPRSGIAGIVTRGASRAVARCADEWDARVLSLAQVAPGSRPHELMSGGDTALVLVGDGEAWQAHWGLLQAIRAEHTLIVDAACPSELRTVAGERGLPPYALPSAGRAWLCEGGRSPRRISLPHEEL